MDNKMMRCAYAGLLHDIGKFYQRTSLNNNLTNTDVGTSYNQDNEYHTYLHGGYTSEFLKNILQLDDNLVRASSAHHLDSLDEFDTIVRNADILASNVDRNDEEFDTEENIRKGKHQYITTQLNSIMSEIDFGKPLQSAQFDLSSIDEMIKPKDIGGTVSDKEVADNYNRLFSEFVKEIKKDNELLGDPTPYKYNRMYSLLYKYTSLIPASTFKTNRPTVSLFDHLKLTAAIASCLAYSNEKEFYMFEFDVSGIQKFIYHITEGGQTKSKISKSLRGRSAFVAILTNAIVYAILNEFSLTQANIIFNTGGGALLLLPSLENTEEKIHTVCKVITEELYDRFNTQLTFVYAFEKVNDFELQLFKSDKALSLKGKLEEEKKRKFSMLINDGFTFEKLDDKEMCELCGDQKSENGTHICSTCKNIIQISDFYTHHNEFSIVYSFDNELKNCLLDLGFVRIDFLLKSELRSFIKKESLFYIDAINHFECGNVKFIANMVPKNGDNIMNFEEITKTLPDEYGDHKLAVLKMDVDNLGAVFAFGLKQGGELQRSLSKYLTLSRMIEFFFTHRLKDICYELSQQLQSKYNNIFYINYAGGDDLLILGHSYAIIQLANRIRDEFKQYVRNDNITLSGGIYIQAPKKPIRFGVKEADKQLDLSKEYSINNNVVKNAISMLDTTVAFDDYDSVLKRANHYCNLIKDEKNSLSRTCFYQIMSYIDHCSLNKYFEFIPIIQYTLVRNIKDDKIRVEVAKDVTTARDEYSLRKLVLMMKLVILMTREN